MCAHCEASLTCSSDSKKNNSAYFQHESRLNTLIKLATKSLMYVNKTKITPSDATLGVHASFKLMPA